MIFVRLSNTFVDLSKQNSKAMENVMYTKKIGVNQCQVSGFKRISKKRYFQKAAFMNYF